MNENIPVMYRKQDIPFVKHFAKQNQNELKNYLKANTVEYPNIFRARAVQLLTGLVQLKLISAEQYLKYNPLIYATDIESVVLGTMFLIKIKIK